MGLLPLMMYRLLFWSRTEKVKLPSTVSAIYFKLSKLSSPCFSNRIINLTDNILINTLQSAYLKRTVSNIIINIISNNSVIIKDFTIDVANFILYSKDKDKFDAVVRVGTDATRNEDVNSFVQECTLLYSSIQSVNQILSIIKCVVFDLKDVPKEFIIKKILNSFNEMFMASLDEICTNLFKVLFYNSEHELSDIEEGIVDEL